MKHTLFFYSVASCKGVELIQVVLQDIVDFAVIHFGLNMPYQVTKRIIKERKLINFSTSSGD